MGALRLREAPLTGLPPLDAVSALDPAVFTIACALSVAARAEESRVCEDRVLDDEAFAVTVGMPLGYE